MFSIVFSFRIFNTTHCLWNLRCLCFAYAYWRLRCLKGSISVKSAKSMQMEQKYECPIINCKWNWVCFWLDSCWKPFRWEIDRGDRRIFLVVFEKNFSLSTFFLCFSIFLVFLALEYIHRLDALSEDSAKQLDDVKPEDENLFSRDFKTHTRQTSF